VLLSPDTYRRQERFGQDQEQVWQEGDASIVTQPQSPELRQFLGAGH